MHDEGKQIIHPWKVLRSRELARTPIFRLTARTSQHPERADAEFYVLEASDWVNIIPLTHDDHVIMVRQYRQGLQRTTLEIPGGMVDPDDSGPLHAARRELEEETGFWARRVEPIGTISPNPAIQDNVCHSFVGRELEPRGSGQLDGNEELTVERVPLNRVPSLIQRGEICHALVVVAFYHFLYGRG
jgi:8-oxo-dGTP pyrophosphatase MutT (NUDIX family)